MRIHHIGYAVRNIKKCRQYFLNLGYFDEGKGVIDVERNIEILFMRNEFQLIELVAPLNEKSSITNLLKRNGAIPYHICYVTHDLEEKVTELLGGGWIITQKPSPAIAMNMKKIVFLYHKDIGIIEITEE
ncbi:MAG: VOC family protein [Lachnospiraceae bacterium]